MKVGKKIRILRELVGYSQDYMSIQLEVSQTTYSRIENQNTRIDISRLISISKILGVTLISLLEFDENNINTLLMKNTEMAKKELPKEQVYLVSRVKNLEEKIDLIQEIILINGK
jgi:transcriptional regulator with XRE-family HTH domain